MTNTKTLKTRFVAVMLILCFILSMAGCKKKPEYDTLKDELTAIMEDRVSHPIIMRIDDTTGASYVYIDDTLCVMYQPSHKNKIITISQKVNNKWENSGYLMRVTEDDYSPYTPKYAVDSNAARANYVTPFTDFEVLSEDKETKTMEISVTFAEEHEEWTVNLENESYVVLKRKIVPTNIYMYDSSTKECDVVFEAVVEEVGAADKNMSEKLLKHWEKALGRKNKK